MNGTTFSMTALRPCTMRQAHEAIHAIRGMEQVSAVTQQFSGETVLLLVYEKYYMRVGSFATLVVLLTQRGEALEAEIIASGGGRGIGNFSYGANERLAKECVEALEAVGFAVK